MRKAHAEPDARLERKRRDGRERLQPLLREELEAALHEAAETFAQRAEALFASVEQADSGLAHELHAAGHVHRVTELVRGALEAAEREAESARRPGVYAIDQASGERIPADHPIAQRQAEEARREAAERAESARHAPLSRRSTPGVI